ncbi:hypothetical protein DI487_04995 [Flavobacterium sediminis]|uniref:Uncharacterized protein n=1 Tax=Flavobacterium sediminis TaxID=2201181 RepID=A0A2U8QSZ4_9FLAO|nr:hypothetical protein DI487_04995 [Flavobacterium sediminis]
MQYIFIRELASDKAFVTLVINFCKDGLNIFLQVFYPRIDHVIDPFQRTFKKRKVVLYYFFFL